VQIGILPGEKIAQHQTKMPTLCDSVFTYRALSLFAASQKKARRLNDAGLNQHFVDEVPKMLDKILQNLPTF
jgi:hypothetical protein